MVSDGLMDVLDLLNLEFSKRKIKYPVPLLGFESISKKKKSKLSNCENSRFLFCSFILF